ncbi:MAG: hypothetical protein HeimC2_42900 [Candidatus Heimdallarchaeota archaeon LC_2]|nr:MAG: hypothetical protein HeimC2_42900 [Candidatus Heimdallarchaeota archaeon LC_2]
MWKEPEEKSLEAPKDMAKLIRKSIYWNTEGKLHGSPLLIVIQYLFIIFLIWSVSSILLISLIQSISSNSIISNALIILGLSSLILILRFFYIWGWKTYSEAWYLFDDKDEILTVIRKSSEGWETLEVPYEEINNIEYNEGPNGKAIIQSGRFEFETNRALDKRATSVTDIWGNLARIDTRMTNWPIEMVCQKCKRHFGHHIGTAICPFCKISLIDIRAKGLDLTPMTQHKDDLDRI